MTRLDIRLVGLWLAIVALVLVVPQVVAGEWLKGDKTQYSLYCENLASAQRYADEGLLNLASCKLLRAPAMCAVPGLPRPLQTFAIVPVPATLEIDEGAHTMPDGTMGRIWRVRDLLPPHDFDVWIFLPDGSGPHEVSGA